MAKFLTRCSSLRILAWSRRSLDEGSVNRLCPRSLVSPPSLSWAQLVSLRKRYSTEIVAGSALEGEEDESKKSSDKGLRLSDSCVKVYTLFLWYNQFYDDFLSDILESQ